jgi:hypothetical protein
MRTRISEYITSALVDMADISFETLTEDWDMPTPVRRDRVEQLVEAITELHERGVKWSMREALERRGARE